MVEWGIRQCTCYSMAEWDLEGPELPQATLGRQVAMGLRSEVLLCQAHSLASLPWAHNHSVIMYSFFFFFVISFIDPFISKVT